ncbi:MAG: TetR/AcrR family transcriptional regulator [Coprobacillaceae bacterium]
MSNSTDIRASYTRKRLVDAMFQLLETKDFYHITVNSICKEASVSRTTFYLHFADKYELTCSCVESIVMSMCEHVKTDNMHAAFTQVVQGTYQRRKALKSLIALGGDTELQQRIDAMFLDIYLLYYQMQEEKGVQFEIPIEMMARYNCAGVTSLTLWWINNDFPVSQDEMVSLLNTTVNKLQ